MKSGFKFASAALRKDRVLLSALSVLMLLGCSSTSMAASEKLLDLPPAKIKLHSPLVTGNGFGYAVVASNGDLTRFYAHPYRYEKANPDPSKDGYTTANFFKKLSWSGQKTATKPEQMGYINESHVVQIKSEKGEFDYFSPFQLKHNVLIAISRTGEKDNSDAVLNAEWLHATTQH